MYNRVPEEDLKGMMSRWASEGKFLLDGALYAYALGLSSSMQKAHNRVRDGIVAFALGGCLTAVVATSFLLGKGNRNKAG